MKMKAGFLGIIFFLLLMVAGLCILHAANPINDYRVPGLVDEANTAITALFDSDNTTTTTSYTAGWRGRVLIGKQGVGTNAVWISGDASSTNWIIVAP